MKRILITGGAGFIGSNLALALIKCGYDVTVLDSLSPQIHGSDDGTNSFLYLSIKDKVNFIKGSVTDREDWLKAIKGQEIIVHLAAETGTGQSMYEIEKYTDTNIGGTALLLDILTNEEHSIKKILIASSRAVYGEGRYYSDDLGYVYPQQRNEEDMNRGDFEVKYPDLQNPLKLVATHEESQIHPTSVYGITKQVQEQLIMNVCPSIGIQPVAFRYQNVYGPGQSLSNPYTGILSIFSTLIRNGQEINIFEDGRESRDFVYIDDVVAATILGIEREEANRNIFNVGTGIATDVLTVANTLLECFQAKVTLNVSGNYRVGDIRHNYADIKKISLLLQYKPLMSFNEGIRKFVNWVNEQQIKDSAFQNSLKEMGKRGLFK